MGSPVDNYLKRYPAGSKIDTDGFPSGQPFQCFDSVLVYVRAVANDTGVYIRCATSGYVKDFWNDFSKNGLNRWFTQVFPSAKAQRGDIAVWREAPATPSSHTAVVLEDRGNQIYVNGQNQPHPYTTNINFTKSGLLGYLRPRNVSTSPATGGGNRDMTPEFIKETYLAVQGRVPKKSEVDFHMAKSNPTSFINGFGGNYAWKSEQAAKNAAIAERDAAKKNATSLQGEIKALTTRLADITTESDAERIELEKRLQEATGELIKANESAKSAQTEMELVIKEEAKHMIHVPVEPTIAEDAPSAIKDAIKSGSKVVLRLATQAAFMFTIVAGIAGIIIEYTGQDIDKAWIGWASIAGTVILIAYNQVSYKLKKEGIEKKGLLKWFF